MNIKKLILATAVTVAFSTPAMASDWFVGGGFGVQHNDNTSKFSTGGSSGDDESDMLYSVRGGYYFTPNHRVYLTYGYNSDDVSDNQMGLLSYDYLVQFGEAKKLSWFIGASAGLSHIDPDDFGSSESEFVYGAQTGLLYNVAGNLDLELGYRYLKQDYETDVDVGRFELDDSQQIYLNVDYRF